MASTSERVQAIRERLGEVPDKARTAVHLARKTGLLRSITRNGLKAMLEMAMSGTRNPSQIFAVHAANSPDKPAILWRDKTLTYGEFNARTDRAAAGLQRRGFKRNTSVVVMTRNRPEFLEVQGGAGRIGAAGVTISWRSTPAELVYLANHCGAKAIVFESDLWSVVEEAKKKIPGVADKDYITLGGTVPGCDRYEEDFLAPSSVLPNVQKGDAEEAAVVIYTSGTTGKPKGAVRKFPKDAVFAILRFLAETPMRVDDVHLVTCPLYHSTAFGFMTMNALLGATSVIMDDFKPESFVEHVARYKVTTTAVVPTMLHRVLALGPEVLSKYDTRSLRAIFSGGAPLPGPLATATLDHFGDVLFNFYGATETGVVTLAKPEDLRQAPATIGKAVPGNEIRLLAEDGHEVAVGEVGELYARNKMLVAGYHNDGEATRSSMKDGFFSVGDLARRDVAGRFFLEGRKRDMIISGGVNVYPAEVEGVLEEHPEVAEVAVVGITDPEWGERVRAFVVRRPDGSVDEGGLKTWCRERLAGPKVPRDYVFLDALPRNPTGKVLKRELRAEAATAATRA